jgi:hypothetical protein
VSAVEPNPSIPAATTIRQSKHPFFGRIMGFSQGRLCVPVRREKEALLDSPIRSSRYNADVAGMGTVPLLE